MIQNVTIDDTQVFCNINIISESVSVCIPRDFDVTNATADRNILLRFRSKTMVTFLFLHYC